MKMDTARMKAVLQFIDDFYDAAIQSSDWNKALGGLERLFPMAGVIFERHDLSDGELLTFESSGLPEEGLHEWNDYFHSICPRVRYLARQPVGTIGYDRRILEQKEMDHHPLYQDFLLKYGVFYFLSATVERDSQFFTSISMQRTVKQGHAEEPDIELLDFLTPHMQNALRVNRCLRSSKQLSAQLEASLHSLKSGVIIVDRHARLEFINQSAEAVVQSKAGIIIDGRSVLSFASPSLEKTMALALADLTSALANPGKFTGFLPANSARPWPLRVDFLKIPARARLSTIVSENDAPSARLLIVVNVPGASNTTLTSLLKNCFQLTNMEAKLAIALAEGERLSHYADQNEVSITTVRTHLVNLRQKMGARTQADVIMIVWQLHGAVY